MELKEEELTEEQLQQMIEFHSKNQTSCSAPSWIKSAATHGGVHPRTCGGSMSATIGGMRSSRGGNLMCAIIGGTRSSRGDNLMSANGGTRSSRGDLVSSNGAMKSSNF